VQAVSVDPATGEFERDAGGNVIVFDSGLLVRFDEVEVLDFHRTN
jgi:hypothetical protein